MDHIYQILCAADEVVFNDYLAKQFIATAPITAPEQIVLFQRFIQVPNVKQIVKHIKANCNYLLLQKLTDITDQSESLKRELAQFYVNNFSQLFASYHLIFADLIDQQQILHMTKLIMNTMGELEKLDFIGSENAIFVNQFLCVATSLTSKQYQFQDVGELLTLRSRIGLLVSKIFTWFFNQSNIQMSEQLSKQLFINVLLALGVILCSPGIKDFNFQNIGGWVEQLIDGFDLSQDSYFRRFIYQKTIEFREENSILVIEYISLIVDILHIMQQFRCDTSLITMKFFKNLAKFTLQISTSTTLSSSLDVDNALKFILVIIQKMSNIIKYQASSFFVHLGCMIGNIYNSNDRQCDDFVLSIMSDLDSQQQNQILIGLCTYTQTFRFRDESLSNVLDNLIIKLLAQNSHAEFLTLIVAANCSSKIEKDVDKYLVKAINVTKTYWLASYLCKKCGFAPDNFDHLEEIEKGQIQQWNQWAAQAEKVMLDWQE